MIDKLKLKNFTVFNDCEFDFSPRVNVIVGENGTGKTHLLKAIYTLLAWKAQFEPEEKLTKKKVGDALFNVLKRQFLVRNETLGELVRKGAKEKAVLACTLADSTDLEFAFGPRSKSTTLSSALNSESSIKPPVLIPAKEVVSFIEGVTEPDSDRATIEKIFDGTYLEIISLLTKPVSDTELAEMENDPRLGTLLPRLCEALGGQFEIVDDKIKFQAGSYKEKKTKRGGKTASQLGDSSELVFYPSKGDLLTGKMTAEGYKKIGVLQQLLRNGTLVPGVSGPLLWDEPEANVNPKLMKLIVEVILDLSRSGQQVILATHDYAMLKWFDLLEDESQRDNVRYHALYRDEDTAEIKVETCTEYRLLNQNAISDSYAEIYDAEVSRALGPPVD